MWLNSAKLINWWLIIVVVAAALLRLVWLDKFPRGFTADEAAFGYNAYSLLLTGRDEWGQQWWTLPFTNLRSFGDYKLPLYVYLTVPAVKIFGLSEAATRLPNALIGTAAVGVVYLLAKKLFGHPVALWAAGLMAISPWHISLSRGAFEANLVTFLLPLAIYMFLQKRAILTAVILAISLYSYHSARVIVPLLLLILMAFSWKERKKWLVVMVMVFGLLAIPAVVSYWGPGRARLADVGIFSPTDNWQTVAQRRFAARNAGLPDFVARLFSNKVTYLASGFTKNYLAYYSLKFLFTDGAGEATYGMLPGRGVLYLVEMLFLASFGVLLVRRPTWAMWMVVLILVIAPLPAALAKGPGHAANRAATMIPFLAIASAVGAVYLGELFQQRGRYVTLVVGVILLSFTFFAQEYLYLGPVETAPALNYGWKELMPRLSAVANRFTQVRVSRTLSEPHIFVAFYLKIPPQTYQEATQGWTVFEKQGFKFLDQLDGYSLGKYRFGDLHFRDGISQPTLYVGRPEDFPPDYGEYFHVDYPSSQPAFKVVERKV